MLHRDSDAPDEHDQAFCDVALGTDGFGRSDSREALRRHFGVDAEAIVAAARAACAARADTGF